MLWPGQYVRVGLVLGLINGATVIPISAVQTSQDRNIVYVIAPGDTVQIRPVVEGLVYGDKVVVEKGVEPGERVVTDGQLLLRPGAKVVVKSGLGEDAGGGRNQ
jgi:multidrug efflux system membrane fusion protein